MSDGPDGGGDFDGHGDHHSLADGLEHHAFDAGDEYHAFAEHGSEGLLQEPESATVGEFGVRR
jgi:hypothetical protein